MVSESQDDSEDRPQLQAASKDERAIWLGLLHSCAAAQRFEIPIALPEEISPALNVSVVEAHVYKELTTLHSAVVLGAVRRTAAALDSGVNVDTRDESGSSVLHVAAATRQRAMLEYLLSRKDIDVDCKDLQGHTPLHVAVLHDSLPLAAMLANDSRLHIDTVDEGGRTALMLAVRLGMADMVECICSTRSFDIGICMSIRDKGGLTPLMAAIMGDSARIVRTLLLFGADPHTVLRDRKDQTPLMRAAFLNFDDIVQALVLDGGSQINQRDAEGNTALHLTTSLTVAEFLVAHGARYELLNGKEEQPRKFAQAAPEGANVGQIINGARAKWDADVDDGPLLPASRKKAQMIADETSPECLICRVEFTMLRRRHHCRGCGLLVCDACSKKRFRIPNVVVNGSPSPAPAQQQQRTPERVCDGCFNQLRHRSANLSFEKDLPTSPGAAAAAAVSGPAAGAAAAGAGAAAAAAGASANPPGRTRAESEAEAAKRDELMGMSAAEREWAATEREVERDRKEKDAMREAASAQQAAGETRQMLVERGEKLEQLQDKSAQLNEQAMTFADLCKQLAEKEKKKSKFGF